MFSRYFYGIIAMVLRFVTKNTEPYLTGVSTWTREYEIHGDNGKVVYKEKGQILGIPGEVTVVSVPPTTIPGNTLEKRKEWVGLTLEGFLLSPNLFAATKHSCHEQLSEDYFNFLFPYFSREENFLLFHRCFNSFHRKKIKFSYTVPFGGCLAGKYFKIR